MTDPSVITENAEWLVLNKPSGWLTIRGAARAPVLADWAQEKWGKLWVVHRLDLQTSGVVLFARHAQAHRKANLWFSAHRILKQYDALARGAPLRPVFQVRSPIEGHSAASQIEVRERWPFGFLARVLPRTGRRHQIRIHLASLGHPIWGDPSYGGPSRIIHGDCSLEVARVALHAAKMSLPSGEVFEAAWPEDFETWVEWSRKRED